MFYRPSWNVNIYGLKDMLILKTVVAKVDGYKDVKRKNILKQSLKLYECLSLHITTYSFILEKN